MCHQKEFEMINIDYTSIDINVCICLLSVTINLNSSSFSTKLCYAFFILIKIIS